MVMKNKHRQTYYVNAFLHDYPTNEINIHNQVDIGLVERLTYIEDFSDEMIEDIYYKGPT